MLNSPYKSLIKRAFGASLKSWVWEKYRNSWRQPSQTNHTVEHRVLPTNHFQFAGSFIDLANQQGVAIRKLIYTVFKPATNIKAICIRKIENIFIKNITVQYTAIIIA